MKGWLVLVAGLLAVMVSWISCGLILAKLKAEGYQFSDLFYPDLYAHYWRIAPQRGWSRIPVFMILTPLLVYASLVIVVIAFW